VGVNCMSANVTNDNASGPPWSGFWYDLMSLARNNIILFFSLSWIGTLYIDLYVKLILLCISFILDRIAVRKAEDVAIGTVDDIKLYSEGNLTEEVAIRKVRTSRKCIKYFSLGLCLLLSIKILLHASSALSNAAEARFNIIMYEIAGVCFFYAWSAYCLVTIPGLRITDERLKNAYAWKVSIFLPEIVSKWRGVGPLYFITFLMMTILFLNVIFKTEKDIAFEYLKYGAVFFAIAVLLMICATYPMAFKGAAYAHYLARSKS
jgi:hypothetical protein